jgi:acetylornithine/succinyldiaminopimelate/putrescine aminotransferase
MRTGTWWNIEQKGVVPDILTFGKGIASGYPMAGMVGTSDILNSLEPGTLGGTYGGNAICSAAASATIDILNDMTDIEYLGKYMKYELEKNDNIKEVRQYGLMIGIEFQENVKVKDLVEGLKQKNILVLLSGNKCQYIRLLPPLNISKEEIDIFLANIDKLL